MVARSESSCWTLHVAFLSVNLRFRLSYLEASTELCFFLRLSCCILDGSSYAMDATYHELKEYNADCTMIGGMKIVNVAFAEFHYPVCTPCLTRSRICTASEHQGMTHCIYADADHLFQ